MNKFGDTLYVQTTDEPVKVLYAFKHLTLVRRPVMGQNGIRYKLGVFFNCELETLQEQTVRTLSLIKARNEITEAEMADVPAGFMPQLAFKKSTN